MLLSHEFRLNLEAGVKMGLIKEVTIEAIKKLPDEFFLKT